MAHNDSTHSVKTINRQVEARRSRVQKDTEHYVAERAFQRLLRDYRKAGVNC